MITKLPDRSPALPHPATALPMMKTAELGAAALVKEPSSNTMSDTRYVHFIENMVKIRPQTGWKAQAVIKYAEPYQPMSLLELSACVTWGIAW